jgi:DNA-binding response OmpR family regulator
MYSNVRLWIIEDDVSQQFVYRSILDLRFDLTFFGTLREFTAAFDSDAARPNMIIADIRLPDRPFLSLLAEDEWKTKLSKIPFLVVSSVVDLDALRFCYDRGAADYITKPFPEAELIAKVERVLRDRRMKGCETELFSLDPARLSISRRGLASECLTSKEFQMMAVFAESVSYTVQRADLEAVLWPGISVTSKALNMHLSNLRRKVALIGIQIRHLPPDRFALGPSDEENSHATG